MTEIWTRSALSGDALVGPYSRFGWHHPGPAWFYVAAPFYATFGRGVGGLAVAAVAVVVASALASVVIVGRVVGGRGAWVVGLTLLGWMAAAGTTWFDSYWNPLVVIGPCLVVGIAAAGLAIGDGTCLGVTVVAGSFAVQTHLGSTPVVVGFVAAGAIALVSAGRWRLLGRRWLVSALAALSVLWALPLWEQLTNDPGNITRLITFVTSTGDDHELVEVARHLGPQLTVLHPDVVKVSTGRGFVGAGAAWLVGLVAFTTGLAVLAYVNHRRRRVFHQTLCLGSALAALLLVVNAARAEGPSYAYLSVSAVAVGAVAWCGIGLTLAAELWARPNARDRRSLRRVVALATTLSLVLSVRAVAPAQRDELRALQPTAPADRKAIEEIVAAVGPSPVLIRIDVLENWPVAAIVANHVEKAGHDFLVDEAWTFMFGDQHERRGCPPMLVRLGAPVPSDALVSVLIGGTPVWVRATSGTGCDR